MANGRPSSHKKAPRRNTRRISQWILGVIACVSILGALVLILLPKGDAKDTKGVNDMTKTVKKRTRGSLTGVINGHEWVDLGLPSGLRWATCNVGASSAEEFGDYFAWGETEPKSSYSSINSLTYKVPFTKLRKKGITDNTGNLTRGHDAASAVWGEPWRMPTDDEYQELISSCTWIFASFNGVNGYLVTGPNKKNIFLPAAAFQQNTDIDNVGEFGDYWSSTIVKELSGVACSLGYSSKSYGRRRYARYAGRTIRPVTEFVAR